MELNFGNAIKIRREELNITQAALCEGIFDTSTLSRIENGRHFPSNKAFAAIAERLGLPSERFTVLSTQKDFEIQEICNEIIDYNIKCQFDKSIELLNKLESSDYYSDKILQQFVLRCKTIIFQDKLTFEEFIDDMTDALKITIPHFEEDSIEKYLLTNNEVKCITAIANKYCQNSQISKGISIYLKLLKVLESNHYLTPEKENAIIGIYCNLSKYLTIARRYEEAIEICDKAKALSIKNAGWIICRFYCKTKLARFAMVFYVNLVYNSN